MDIDEHADEPGQLRFENGGPDRPRINPFVWVAVALVGLVAGFFVLGRGMPDAQSAQSPRPTQSPTHQNGPKPSPPSPRPVTGPNQRQYVAVTMICPAITDHRKQLAVTFQVSNVSDSDVFVTSVRSVLPLHGLRQRGVARSGGSCVNPNNLASRGLLKPDQSQYYTLSFALPKGCPAQYAVQVRVDYKADGFTGTSLSQLLSDLSVLDFDACPSSV